MVAPTNVRFSEPVHDALSRFVHQSGRTKSAVINTAVDEWLRMQRHSGIRFVSIETGERRATLIGGPQVWTVGSAWLDHDPSERSVEAVARTLGLTAEMVDAAVSYWAAHQDEIDDIIERHRAAQDEALLLWERRRSLESA